MRRQSGGRFLRHLFSHPWTPVPESSPTSQGQPITVARLLTALCQAWTSSNLCSGLPHFPSVNHDSLPWQGPRLRFLNAFSASSYPFSVVMTRQLLPSFRLFTSSSLLPQPAAIFTDLPKPSLWVPEPSSQPGFLLCHPPYPQPTLRFRGYTLVSWLATPSFSKNVSEMSFPLGWDRLLPLSGL